mgnify:CR=1 FL=1
MKLEKEMSPPENPPRATTARRHTRARQRRATRPREYRGNGTNERGEKTTMRCARAMTRRRRRRRSTRARAVNHRSRTRWARYFCVTDEGIGRRRRRRRRSRAGRSCTFRLDSVGIKSGPSFGRCEDDDDDGGGNARGGRAGVFAARASQRGRRRRRARDDRS